MIAAIELAMIEQLRAIAATGAPGFTWRTLTTYPDDWDEYLLSQSEIRTPAAWVVFAGWNAAELDGEDDVLVDASFGVMVADENLRQDEQYQRHGSGDPAKEPGSYRLLLAAVASLAGQTLGLDLSMPLKVGALRAVRPNDAIRKRKLSMYAVEFTTRFPIALAGGDPTALDRLHVNWDVPRFDDPHAIDADGGATGRQLPDDAHADATDILDLEND